MKTISHIEPRKIEKHPSGGFYYTAFSSFEPHWDENGKYKGRYQLDFEGDGDLWIPAKGNEAEEYALTREEIELAQ